MTVWQSARTFDGTRTSPTTWLTMIARNKSIDRVRSNRPLASVPSKAVSREERGNIASELRPEAYSNDRAKRMSACMGGMPLDQRQAMELAFFDGLTHPEIAVCLNETIETVKSRIHLGMDRLREMRREGHSSSPFDSFLPLAFAR